MSATAAAKLLDATFKIIGYVKGAKDARAAEVKLLRMLYLEVSQNLELLERVKVKDREGLAANDEAYREIAAALDVAAHQAVVLVRDESTDDIQRAADAKAAHDAAVEAHEDAEAARTERLAAFQEVWGELCDDSWELAPSGPIAEESAAQTEAPAPVKNTTLLKSLAFVVVKRESLVKLCALPESTEPAQRRLLIATRLEHIRRHERALQRRLEQLPSVAPIRV